MLRDALAQQHKAQFNSYRIYARLANCSPLERAKSSVEFAGAAARAGEDGGNLLRLLHAHAGAAGCVKWLGVTRSSLQMVARRFGGSPAMTA